MVFCMFTRGYLYSTRAFVKRLVNQPVFSQALVAVIPDGVIDVHRNICHIDPPPELWVEILIPNLFFNTKNDQSICGSMSVMVHSWWRDKLDVIPIIWCFDFCHWTSPVNLRVNQCFDPDGFHIPDGLSRRFHHWNRKFAFYRHLTKSHLFFPCCTVGESVSEQSCL